MALTVRYYLFPELADPVRIPKRLLEGLSSGEDAIPAFSLSSQRALSALVDNQEGAPQELLRIDGEIWHFDADGRIDRSLQESLFQQLEHANLGRRETEGKVVALAPKLSKRMHDEKFRWEPSAADIDLVIGDIWPRKGAKRLKDLKGVAPRRPPLTYEARHALDETSSHFFAIGLELQKLSEPALKGLIVEARTRAREPDDDTFLYEAVALTAERRLEILKRRRTGKGQWYAVVTVTRSISEGADERVNEYVQACQGQGEAIMTARKMLAEHAGSFSRDTTVEASLRTDIEHQMLAGVRSD